jgi:hypothetical protein
MEANMIVYNFESLIQHVGHQIEVVTYGNPPVNVAIECVDCNTVLLDFDVSDEEEEQI